MNLTIIFLSLIFLIFLIFFGGISINYRDKYNALLTEVRDAEEARNVGRTRIPVTWNGVCKYVYVNSTPEEFVHQFGKPLITETHTFYSGKYLSLFYADYECGPKFMHVWFNSNYELDDIKIS